MFHLSEVMNETAGTTPQTTQRGRLNNTIRGRMMMRYLTVLMFMESLVWTAMDLIRAHRMRWSRKMKQYDGTLTSNKE